MPRNDYKRCKECNGHVDDVGHLSHTRLCGACGVKLARRAALDLANHGGPYFDAWRLGMLGSVFPQLLDVVRPKP
jgi:hypothetical protein